MTRIGGSEGSITLPTGHAGVMRQWTATARRNLAEVTGFGDTINRRFRTGIIQVEGSATGSAESTTAVGGAANIGSAGSAITLLAQTGNQWAFTAIMSSIGLSSDQNAECTLTFDFTNGDVNDFAETWG